MKRILILLVLICSIFCEENPCFDIAKTAKNAKECASRTRVNKENVCCIIQVSGKNTITGKNDVIGECYEFMKGVTEETVKQVFDAYFKNLIPFITDASVKSFKCSSSFLKVGFLLSILFLL